MSKPSWNDAPRWARFLAQDADGCWWWYENKPNLRVGLGWSAPGNLAMAFERSEAWADSMEKRP